uniref:Secreted protein n=2 Tax=Bursaphelenchus xylophilus TaxID=6326 RepID=A0A1I7S1Q2_BURXY
MNRKFLFPFVCLARRKCSEYLTDSFYTLTYAHQMLHLETNDALNCSETDETDVPEALFEMAATFPAHGILNHHFCQHISTPPRLTLKESFTNNLVISVEVDFHWP